jgi:hypothetical protein
MFEPREYQKEISEKGYKILNSQKILVLNMQVRTGKTITSFLVANKAKCESVLFITKKKVIESNTIKNDFDLVKPSFSLTQINFESVHKVNGKDFDLIIVDESHSLGAYPKPSQRTKKVKEIISGKRVILLTGTLSPESYSQIFHQFWISEFSPFTEKSFYKWAQNYVNITKKKINGYDVNNYSDANENLIRQKTAKHILTYTQEKAGFTTKVNEHVLYVKMKPTTYELVNKLKKDLVFEGKNGGVILADTGVKLLQKVHQIYSGTVKLEDGTGTTIDTSKADFIKERFKGKKIGIFYKFKQELELLKNVFGSSITTELNEFNTMDKNMALQIISKREGISLKNADYLIFFNIDYSATSYFQAKDRMTTKERLQNDVYWIFSKGGIEDHIYKQVSNKKNFTLNHFKGL